MFQIDPALLPFAVTDTLGGSGSKLQNVEPQSQIHPIESDIPRRMPLRKLKRRKEVGTDTQMALRMLAKTRQELLSTSKHLPSLEERDGWGYKSLEGSGPLTTVGTGTHKPPMLSMMENVTIKSLSQINSQYKSCSFPLLPISCVDNKDDNWDAVAVSLATLRQSPKEVTAEATLSMLVNENEEGDKEGDKQVNEQIEIDAKGASEFEYRSKRLATFRRMIKIFTSAFKTYRPMLSWVFNEYDSFFKLLTTTIEDQQQSLEAASAKATALNLHHQTREAAHNSIVKSKDKTIATLQKRNDMLTAENAKFGKTYTQNMLHIKELEENSSDLEEVKTYLQKRVSKLERRLYDEQHQQEKSMRDKLADDLDRTIRQLSDLRRLHEVILKENRFYKEKFETIQKQKSKAEEEAENKTDTPRPNWTAAPLCGIEWKGTTSDTVLHLAAQLQDLTQKVNSENSACDVLNRRFILGLGLGTAVQPSFLRFVGRLDNLKLTKSQVEQIIKQFWREKDRSEDTRTFSPASFFPMFINEKFGPPKAMEMIYNVWYSLQKYKSDPDCGLFFKILDGSVDEIVWREQSRLVFYLREVLSGIGEDVKTLDISEIMNATRRVFPTKEEQQFEVLEDTLKESCPENSTAIEYLKLFDEDAECNQHPFIELLRTQHIIERDEYLNEIEDSLIGHDDASDGIISVPEMINAIRAVDDIPDEALNALIARAFNISPEQDHLQTSASTSMVCSLNDVVNRLKTGNVKRYSKKKSPKDDPSDVPAMETSHEDQLE